MSEIANKYGSPSLPIVNLLPPDIGEKRKLRQVQSLCLLILAGVVGLVVFLFLGATAAKTLAKNDLDNAADNQKLALAERNALQTVLQDYRNYENKQFVIAQAGWGEVDYSQLLRAILSSTDANTFIAEVSVRTPAADVYSTDTVETLSPLGVGSVEIVVGGLTPADVVNLRERLTQVPGLQWIAPRSGEWSTAREGSGAVWTSDVSAVLTQELLTKRFFPTGVINFDPVQMARMGLPRFDELVAEQNARNADSEGEDPDSGASEEGGE